MADSSVVHLVGAGPGDPDLLTVRGRRLLERADVVVYDRLVSEEILALIPTGATRLNVGKQPGRHPVPQNEINRLLVHLAKEGRTVVRLKGGDPMMFGRGGEEAEYLERHGVRCEVTPGVTAASACAAAIGIPLTHRGLASGVRFVTGQCRNGVDFNLDWRGLADSDTTLAIYMGQANIGQIADQLMSHGLPASTPAAAINNGTTPRQRHVVESLGTIAERATRADFRGPVLFIVGRTVTRARPGEELEELEEYGDDMPVACSVR